MFSLSHPSTLGSSQMSIEHCLSNIKQNAVFATTPAEFNLTSRSQHFPEKSQCPYTRNNSVDPTVSRRENLTELIRLRSSAFWELRQSIAENGEGLVRRMRDYEGSRSRHNIHLKVKEAEKRDRKRVSFKNRTTSHNSSDVSSDDEDIQICSGDSNNIPFRGGRGRSLLGAMNHHQLDSWHMQSCPTYGPQCSSNLQLDFFTPTEDTESSFPSSNISSSPNSPCLPYEPTKSSPASPPLCEPLSLNTNDLPLLSTTSYHKVIASLNLALANGAGSVEDYSSLWEYQSRFQTEYYDHGDLWH